MARKRHRHAGMLSKGLRGNSTEVELFQIYTKGREELCPHIGNEGVKWAQGSGGKAKVKEKESRV